jgi:hypothetical protein
MESSRSWMSDITGTETYYKKKKKNKNKKIKGKFLIALTEENHILKLKEGATKRNRKGNCC